MAVLSCCWLGAAAILEVEQSAPLSSLWQGYGDPLAWLVLLWPAVGQYSTGEAAQVAGQAEVRPSPPHSLLTCGGQRRPLFLNSSLDSHSQRYAKYFGCKLSCVFPSRI